MRKNDLFDLVRSLHAQEVKYFKQFSARHKIEDNRYVELFDLIREHPEMSEAGIRTLFSKQAGNTNYPKRKAYLYESLLKFLVWENLEKTDSNKQLYHLLCFNILIERKLYRQALELMESNLVFRSRNFLRMISIRNIAEIALITKDISLRKKYLEDADLDVHLLLEQESKTEKLLRINFQMRIVYDRIGDPRTLEEKHAYLEILRDVTPDLDDKYVVAHNIYRNLKYYACKLQGDTSGCLEIMESMHAEYLRDADLRNSNVMISFLQLNDTLIKLCFDLQDTEKMRKYISAMESMQMHSEISTFMRDLLVFEHLLRTCLLTGDRVEGVALMEKFSIWEKQNALSEDILHTKYDVYFACVLFYFRFREYENAITYIHRIVNDGPARQKNTVVYTNALILYLLAQFSLENDMVLSSALRSAVYTLRSLSRYNHTEKLFISTIRKLHKAVHKKEKHQLLTELNDSVEALKAIDTEVFGLTGILESGWLQHALESHA